MIATPEILHTEAHEAAVIHLKIPRVEMMKQFGPAVGELFAELSAQGVEPTSPVFAHHLAMSAEFFDFELGVRVAAPVKAAGRMKPGELPSARVARTVYTGPYEGLPCAWGDFMTWMSANGHAPAADLWEIYAVGPQSTPDPTQWQTELYRPLKG